MNISLERSKFSWILSAISRSPAKLVRKDAWNSQSSLDYSGNLAVTNKTGMKKTLGTAKVRISYFGNLMVTSTTDTKISLQQIARCTEIASVVQTLFDQQLHSV